MTCRPTKCLVVLLSAHLAARAVALDGGHSTLRNMDAQGVDSKASDSASEQSEQRAKVIPAYKLDMLTNNGQTWWARFGDGINIGIHSLWGNDMPQVTSSPAQDQLRCPIIKLPESFNGVAKKRSWTSLSGELETNSGITLATWEQNFLAMAFTRDIKNMGISFRSASTGQVAVRTKLFTDKEMSFLYSWKVPPIVVDTIAQKKINSTTKNFNLAIIDCVGTLMYVVREEKTWPHDVLLYSRNGTLVAQSRKETPVLRYQWIDPKTKYLIATAEAPGYRANISESNIPKDAEVGNVIPFGFHFQEGGYANSSALMEPEFHWVLAIAVQALAINKAEYNFNPWRLITVVEVLLVIAFILAIGVVIGLAFLVYRTVFPHGADLEKDYHGKIADNPLFAVPDRPPHRDEAKRAAQSRQQIAYYDWSMGRYNRV